MGNDGTFLIMGNAITHNKEYTIIPIVQGLAGFISSTVRGFPVRVPLLRAKKSGLQRVPSRIFFSKGPSL